MLLLVQCIQRFLEAVGVRTFGLGQRFKPVCDFIKAFIACCLGHTRVHISVLMRLTGNSRGEVVRGSTDRQSRCRIADLFQVFQMAVRVTGFTFSGGTKNGGNIVVTFYISLGCEIQITAVCLRFAGKRIFKILLC